ncbi:PfkB family carbohydrate kinase, partial [Singulisphaera rosea]
MKRRTLVFGPAYLDRVLRVDRPLVDRRLGPPLDQSVDGRLESREGITILDPSGHTIAIDPPEDWPGPWGLITLSRSLIGGAGADRTEVKGTLWQDDLGGMGAGYAAAFGGELISALGPEGDPTSVAVAEGLRRAGI